MTTDQELRDARERFGALMQQRSREADFQKLFSDCPYILSRTLPLKLEPSDIRPLGRPGKSEPDFVAIPAGANITGGYGIIELKRPDTKILTQTRKGLLILTREADTAIGQGEIYRDALEQGVARLDERVLMLGNRSQIFIIMGLSAELIIKLGAELLDQRIRLPDGCQLIPYDTLLGAFSATVPPKLIVLVPDMKSAGLDELLRVVDGSVYWWNKFTLNWLSWDFWTDVEDRFNDIFGSSSEFFPVSKFIVQDGPYAGALATETDNNDGDRQ